MPFGSRRWATAGLLLLTGCGLTLDLDPADPQPAVGGDGGMDAAVFDAGKDAPGADVAAIDVVTVDAPPDPCPASREGSSCGDDEKFPLICVHGACVASSCGDGVVDPRDEECDDANLDSGDGCEPGTCVYTCESEDECDDEQVCNGVERCDETLHRCDFATVVPGPEITCTFDDGTTGTCRSGFCGTETCPNGALGSGEECDDGNYVRGDGCEPDCTYTCESNEECSDADPCNGTEACDSHVCVLVSVLACAGGSACMPSRCEPFVGCVTDTIDADLDGQSPASLGECGEDCRDDDPPRSTRARPRAATARTTTATRSSTRTWSPATASPTSTATATAARWSWRTPAAVRPGP